MRVLRILLLWLAVSSAANAQFPQTRNPNEPVTLTIRITFEDGTPLGDAGPLMQVRAELQDATGIGMGREKAVDREGRVEFTVRYGGVYRLRIFGDAVQEFVREAIAPREEAMLHITVRRPATTGQPVSNPSTPTVSAKRLAVPSSAEKELNKGNEALARQDLTKARKHFEKAIEIYPEFDQAHNNLGVVLMQEGKPTAGREAFLRAIELNDRFARAYLNLAKISISEQDWANANNLLIKSISADPTNPHTFFLAAETSLQLGKLDAVLTNVQKLHSMEHGNFAIGHYFAGKAYQAKNMPEQAVAEYKVFLKEAPDDPNTKVVKRLIKSMDQKQ